MTRGDGLPWSEEEAGTGIEVRIGGLIDLSYNTLAFVTIRGAVLLATDSCIVRAGLVRRQLLNGVVIDEHVHTLPRSYV